MIEKTLNIYGSNVVSSHQFSRLKTSVGIKVNVDIPNNADADK